MMPYDDILIQLIDTPPISAELFDLGLQPLIRGADAVALVADMGNDDGPDILHAALRRLEQTKTRLAPTSYLSDEDVGLSFTRTLLVMNKVDLDGAAERIALCNELAPTDFPQLEVSTTSGAGIETLKTALFESLDVVRVYTKAPNRKEVDRDKPFTLKRGSTLLDVAELIHADLAERFRFAKVWDSDMQQSATQKGDYAVRDGDVVEIHA